MKVSRTVRPAHPILFLHGAAKDWLDLIWGAQIQATTDVISIGCQANIDGSTEVELGDMSDVAWPDQPHFDGVLQVDGGTLTISTVEESSVLTIPVPDRVRVKIWRNDARWADKIAIGVAPLPANERMARWIAPEPGERVAIVPQNGVVKSLFVAGGRLPDRWGGYDPWKQLPDLKDGILLPGTRPVNLLLMTGGRSTLGQADADKVLPTPDRKLMLFENPPGRPVLNVDVPTSSTRVEVFMLNDRFQADVLFVVSEAS